MNLREYPGLAARRLMGLPEAVTSGFRRFQHLRRMGSSQAGILSGRMRQGSGRFFMGTGLVYMLASAINRLPEKPYAIGSLAMLWGWLRAAIKRQPRYGDEAFRRFIQRYQRRVLQVGKRRATAEIDRLNSQATAPASRLP